LKILTRLIFEFLRLIFRGKHDIVLENIALRQFWVDSITSIDELLKKLECIHGSKPENVCADCDKLVKTLTLSEIHLRKTGSIRFSMNLIPFQNNMAQRLLTSY